MVSLRLLLGSPLNRKTDHAEFVKLSELNRLHGISKSCGAFSVVKQRITGYARGEKSYAYELSHCSLPLTREVAFAKQMPEGEKLRRKRLSPGLTQAHPFLREGGGMAVD